MSNSNAVTVAQALASSASNLIVVDTAANIAAALPNQALVARVTSFTLSAPAQLTAGLAERLAGLGAKYHSGGMALTVRDSLADITNAANSGGIALASNVQVADAAYNLLSAPTSAFTHVTSVDLIGSPTLSVAQLAHLESLRAFSVDPTAHVTLADSLTNIASLLGAHPAWFAQLSSISVQLDGSQIGAYPAAQVEGLISHGKTVTFTPSGTNTTLNILAAAHDLAANAANLNQLAQHVGLAINVSNDGTAISATDGAALSGLSGFNPHLHTLLIADTASNIAAHASALFGHGYLEILVTSGSFPGSLTQLLDPSLQFVPGASAVLASNANATAAQATALVALPGFTEASGVSLTISDTAAQLAVAAQHNWGAINPTYVLTGNGTLTAAQATEFAGLGTHFSANGIGLSVSDTAANIAGAASAIQVMNATAHVSDTAANVAANEAALIPLGNLSITLTDAAPVTAAAAFALAPLAHDLTGPVLNVSDTAANVDSRLAGLTALGSHVAISVTDVAANVGASAADLATLSSVTAISLTDTQPVSAATIASLQPVASELAHGTALTVNDTVANVVTEEPALFALNPAIAGITLTGSTQLTVAQALTLAPLAPLFTQPIEIDGSASAFASAQNALENLAGSAGGPVTFVAANETVADVTANLSALNSLGAHVSVQDSAASVAQGLDALGSVVNVTAIHLTDSGAPVLNVSLSQLLPDAHAIAAIQTPFSLSVSGPAAAIAQDLAAGNSSIRANLAHISVISASDGNPLDLTTAQIEAAGMDSALGDLLTLFTGSIRVTDATVANLVALSSLQHVPASIDIADAATNISADLAQGVSSKLLTNASIASMTVTDGNPITLTATQLLAAGIDNGPESLFTKFVHLPQLVVTGSTVAQLTQLGALAVLPTQISVVDTASNVEADLANPSSALISALPELGTIDLGGGNLTLTEAQIKAASVDDTANAVLAHLVNGSITVTGVLAADVTEILALPKAPGQMTISDSASQIAAHLDTIAADAGHITGITVTSGPLVLTEAQAVLPGVANGPGSIVSDIAGGAYDVTGVTVAQIGAVEGLANAPSSITVNDTSASIAADLASASPSIVGAISHISAISVQGGVLTLSDSVVQSLISGGTIANVVAALDPSTQVDITGAPISDPPALVVLGAPHLHVSVADSLTSVLADLGSTPSALTQDASSISGVALTSGGTVTAAQLATLASVGNLSVTAPLTVNDTASAIAGLTAPERALASHVDVTDTTANVLTNLDVLQNAYGGNLTITPTDSLPISVSAATYQTDKATLDAIASDPQVTVTGTAAEIAPMNGILANDPKVTWVIVTDSAFNVVANSAALTSVGGIKLAIYLTDTSVSASLVPSLAALGPLVHNAYPVADTGVQIASLVETNPSLITLLNAYGASLSVDSTVSVADTSALASLTSFSKAGHSLSVWDTASHLTAGGAAAILANPLVDAIYLKAPGNAVTLSAGSFNALISLPNFSLNNPGGAANLITVSDSAANLEANHVLLETNASHVQHFVINGSATVNEATLTDLQALNATTAPGVSLTVRDTAANIAANAPTQLSSGAITPVSWTLSGSATVSEATAAALAKLPHFSTGGYTLTLNLAGDTAISVSDANALATIRSSLNLNGHHLLVSGSVSMLTGLTTGALSLVVPQLDDTLAHIVALPATSPLLSGTVTISDSETIDAATAGALLLLVHAGSDITPGALSFGANVETVTDTLANIEALTGSQAWSSNSSLQSAFSLTVSDTIATLTDAANAAFLSGVHASTLSAATSVTAATAEDLADIASSIHLSLGSQALTIVDTAANILAPANANGLALATSLVLSGPDQVNAAGAETLLADPRLDLTSQLTIVDNSTDLLDGTLSSLVTPFASHILVELAAPETVDMQTAQDLVALPGFTGQNLTIADSSAYLLESVNISLEQMATEVTLAGDETVSANTVLRLSELPNFSIGDNHLTLANNDFADAATLKAIGDLGSAFSSGGHSITMTEDALSLTPTEYVALAQDNVSANGHLMSAELTGATASEIVTSTPKLVVTADGIAGATAKLYDNTGTLLSSTVEQQNGFTITANELAPGQNFAITETVNGVESAPIVILDANAIEAIVASAGSQLASSGTIQVAGGEYLNLYQSGQVPTLSAPALVYDAAHHTVALDIPNQAPVTLVTLGGTTDPATLDLTNIVIKHIGGPG